MNVQWYPGHMTKARRQMQEDIALIDLIIELVDARAPMSSRNPDIDEMGKNRSRLILLNKADLADPELNKAWEAYFQNKGYFTACLDARSSADMKAVSAVLREASEAKRERDRKRGIRNRPVRAMVAGIPNAGKSTFINSFAGKAVAKTGNKPGVTRGKQWIKLSREAELLDTPGILWPKLDDQEAAVRLAYIGSIKDDILNIEELSLGLIDFLREAYPGTISGRYDIPEEGSSTEVLENIAFKRGCIKKGEEPDYARASQMFLTDFRAGALGRITLEKP
ncbi:MAG: ribosome biogenesis GTPase YlqF [Blautia sp.]|nr:ribosome biogenesis GTPase YlqF [Blautia sp.]